MTERPDWKKRLDGLLSETITSEDTYVNYSLDQMRRCLQDNKMLEQQRAQTRRRLQQIEDRILEVNAAFTKYGEDVRHFDEEMKKMDMPIPLPKKKKPKAKKKPARKRGK